jgi:hypothetical protein
MSYPILIGELEQVVLFVDVLSIMAISPICVSPSLPITADCNVVINLVL